MNSIPDRWLNYNAIGNVIADTRFIAFKVPLKKDILNNIQDPNDVFGLDELFKEIKTKKRTLGLVIDLTNTTRYYDYNDLIDRGSEYKKIYTKGHEIPDKMVIKSFFDVVDDFLAKNKDEANLIGVHCTHGVNRTGYLISRYMRDRLNFKADDAIEEFSKARGHPIERNNYLNNLRSNNIDDDVEEESQASNSNIRQDSNKNQSNLYNNNYNNYYNKNSYSNGNNNNHYNNNNYSNGYHNNNYNNNYSNYNKYNNDNYNNNNYYNNNYNNNNYNNSKNNNGNYNNSNYNNNSNNNYNNNSNYNYNNSYNNYNSNYTNHNNGYNNNSIRNRIDSGPIPYNVNHKSVHSRSRTSDAPNNGGDYYDDDYKKKNNEYSNNQKVSGQHNGNLKRYNASGSDKEEVFDGSFSNYNSNNNGLYAKSKSNFNNNIKKI